MAGWNERDARFDHRPEPEPPMQWDEALLVRIEQLIGALKVDSPENPAPSRSLRSYVRRRHPINQRVAGEMLRKAGHRVDIAASGAEAVDRDGRRSLRRRADGRADAGLRRLQRDGRDPGAGAAHRRAHADPRRHGVPDASRRGALPRGRHGRVQSPSRSASRACCRRCSSWRTRTPPSKATSRRKTRSALDARAILSPDIAALLLTEYTHHLANIRSALGAGDLQHVERLAHRLKGAVGLFHAAHAYDAADRLEQIASTGDIAETTAIWKRLGGELERLIVELGGTPAPGSDRP